MNARTMKHPAALLTALCLLIALLPSAAVTAETVQEQPKLSASTTVTETTNTISPSETIAEDCKILNYVDEAVFRQNNHLSRLESEESLDTYVFLNQDGSKTVYYMGEAVKYRDSIGTIREKDITLTLRNGNYTTTQNNVLLSIPTNPSNGIRVNYGGYQVSLLPQGGSMLTLPRLVDNTVSYTNYFGTGMTLNYTPTLSGVKEDIILSSYKGVSSFSFLLNTGSLYLYQTAEGAWLSPAENDPLRIWLGDIVVYDAIGKPGEGTLTVSTVTPGQQYRLTVSADPEFLTDPETVYPVTIDPTLTVSDNTYGAGAIADAPIFQSLPNGNFGNFPFNRVGNAGGNYGVGRTVVRLTGLINDAAYSAVSSDQISSVVFYIREGSGKSGTVVNLHPLTSNSTWSETGVTWNNVGTYAASAATVTLTGNRFAAFDITDLAQNWKQNVYNANCGFVLISTTETTGNNALCSSEYTTTDWRPYVVATYQFDSETLSVGEGSTLALTPPDISGTVTWASNNTAIATVNSSGVVTGVRAGSADITASVGGAVHKTYHIEVTIPNGIYRIKNAVNGLYMSVKDAGITDGTQLIQQGLYNTDPLQLGQLWRITHLGSGCYTIRPLHMQSMGLTYYMDYLRIEDIGTNNSVSGCARWRIFYESTGYVFRNAESGITILPTGNSNAPGTILKLDDYSSTNAHFRWTPTLIGTVNSDLLLYDTATGGLANNAVRYVAPGETLSLSQLQLAISFSSAVTMDQSVTWTTSNPSAVTVNAATGTVTGLTPCTTTTITATKIVNGITCTESYTLHVTAVPEGAHFIRSKSSGKYVDIKDQIMADGTVIHQWDFHGGDTQRWVFTRLDDGTYTIHSANSTDTYYLGVGGTEGDDNRPIVLHNSEDLTGTVWEVDITTSGAYKLTPLIDDENGGVLALEVGNLWGQAEENGDVLQRRDYVDDTNYKDEWELARADALWCVNVPNLAFSIQYIGEMIQNDIWYPKLVAATNSWNSSTVGAQLSLTADTSSYTCTVGNFTSQSWYGLATVLELDGTKILSAKIEINAYALPSTGNRGQGTIAHEIGHILGLADNPQVINANDSLMRYDRDHESIFSPQPYDEYNVRFIHKIA